MAMHAGSSFSVRHVPLFPLVAGIGLTVGFLVPVAFEWTEQPWNRTRLVGMERAAMVTMVVTCAVCALGAFITPTHFAGAPVMTANEQPRKVQFRLWQLFAVMTLTAVLLAVMKWLDVTWASGLVSAVALGVLGWALIHDARVRARAGALVAGMFCPMVWMVLYNAPFTRTSGLVAAIPIAPAILPAALIRALLDSRGGSDQMGMVAGVIVIGEMLLGAWLAWRGGKLFVAYLVLVLLVSSVSSFGMHAMYRA